MRLPTGISLRGVNAWLPEGRELTADAVRDGLIPADRAADLGVEAVPVATADLLPPDMAIAAARHALAVTGRDACDIGLLVHCSIWHQGYDMWSGAHRIAAGLEAERALPVNLNQGCNAVMPAIQLAAAQLAADPALTSALITAADRFISPGFDRWSGNYGCVHGDAASAVLVERGGAPDGLLLRSLAHCAVPEFEEMNRAGLEPTPAPRWVDGYPNLGLAKKSYLERYGIANFQKSSAEAIRNVIGTCLEDAGISGDDPRIKCVTMPRMSRTVIAGVYLPIIAEFTQAPPLPLSHKGGHLSCTDILANLADMRETHLLEPGDIGVVVNAGGGYTWSALAVEVPAC